MDRVTCTTLLSLFGTLGIGFIKIEIKCKSVASNPMETRAPKNLLAAVCAITVHVWKCSTAVFSNEGPKSADCYSK